MQRNKCVTYLDLVLKLALTPWRKCKFGEKKLFTFQHCASLYDLELINDIVILTKCCVAMEIYALPQKHNEMNDSKSITNSYQCSKIILKQKYVAFFSSQQNDTIFGVGDFLVVDRFIYLFFLYCVFVLK